MSDDQNTNGPSIDSGPAPAGGAAEAPAGSLAALKQALQDENAAAAAAEPTRALREARPADKHGWWWAVGRRKRAVARCRLRPAAEGEGSGKLIIQKSRKAFKTPDDYFSEAQDIQDAYAPTKVTDTAGKLDLVVRVTGGGHTAQAQAIRLSIARALRDYDPTLEGVLRDYGYLTVDSRQVERKKYGQPGARRSFQFSKR